MLKPILVAVVLLLSAVQGEPSYTVSFAGEDLGPIEDISLSADDHYVYVAYTPPDEDATIVVVLTPELEEVSTTRADGVTSPCVAAYDTAVYLAGIKDEDIVVQVFSADLEFVREYTMTVEEPVDVHILPYEEGILLAYAHRFLENDLLRQDVFVRKVDFSFSHVAEARFTSWDFWEDPTLALYNDSIILSYGNAPLVSIFGRHIIVKRLNRDLEEIGEIRYPALVSDRVNVVQGATAVVGDDVVLFVRVTDRDFSVSRFTWEGMTTVVPGNIRAVPLVITDDLSLGEEIVLTEDVTEEYEPAAVSAFGGIYFGFWMSENDQKTLQVVYGNSLEELKIEPPGERSYLVPITIGALVALAGILFLVKKRSKKGKKKSRK